MRRFVRTHEMNMLKTTTKLLLLILIGCTIGKQGVYFGEMGRQPVLILNNDPLTVRTSNSKQNSALLIYEINISVDQDKKEVYMSANQAAGKDYRDTFVFKLSEYKINDAKPYVFYWRDPDNKTTKLILK